MTIESMFEKAARQKIRIPCEKGWLYVEDLFDLSLESLNNIYKILNAQLKSTKEDSLLDVTFSSLFIGICLVTSLSPISV